VRIGKLSMIFLGLISTQAFASELRLYGIADVAFEYAKGSQAVTRLADGGNAASRFGFAAKEDLGGGMFANMVLEAGFNLDSGSQFFPTLAFGRQAFVGLGGPWGEARFGRQYSPAFYALLKLDPFGLNGQTSPFNGFSSAAAQGKNYVPYTSRFDNAIEYLSPNWNGFSFAGMVALGEVADDTKAGSAYSANAMYENENAYLFYTYLGRRGGVAVQSSLFSTHLLGGAYRFGPVRVGTVFARTNTDYANTPFARSNGLTFQWDVTGTDALKAAVTKRHVSLSGDSPLFATLGWDHVLSKRTTLYSRVVFVNNSAGGSSTINSIPIDAGSGDNGRSISLGVSHRF
jgi:predicted porin